MRLAELERHLLVVSIGVALLVGHISTIIYACVKLYHSGELAATAILISNLVLDAALIVPAVTLLEPLLQDQPIFTPWFLLSSLLLVLAAEDGGLHIMRQ